MSDSSFFRVAVPAPLYGVFDYLAPGETQLETCSPGVRVVVPFGRGERCGVLLAVVEESDVPRSRLKRVVRVLDEAPLFQQEDLALLRWAAQYYLHPLGEVISTALPVRLRKGERPVTSKRSGWRLTTEGDAVRSETLHRAPRQLAVLHAIREAPGGLSREELYEQCDECRDVLRRLEKKGWVEPCEIEPVAEVSGFSATRNMAPELNPMQQAAVDEIQRGLSHFAVYLLDGVTGSGKTEVYLSLIEQVIAQGLQVLVLVPEIGLTPQLLRRFRRRLAVPLSLMHSGLSDTQREAAWHEARLGRGRVVLGTRSALYTPMPELGLIIVDEEHDLSFKQQDGFRYSARDMAVIRGQRGNCPVVLGSATPSLESMNNALSGRYQHLKLPLRAGGAQSPDMDLIDVRSVRLEAGLSPTLMRMLKEQLDSGNQVLLFLNRRGYAPVVTCHDCGWISVCRRCDARMTLHMGSQLLWCHHCGSQRRLEPKCPECGGDQLKPMGQGTERLEEVLRAHFPEAGIARIDRDTTRRKGSLESLLGEIREGKYSLLIGTQMLAKGHHFPNVTLAAILDVDQGLFGADYRAAERMAQLIIQVAGRAGRAEKRGRVVIQTRHPDHPLLHTLIREGYDAFATAALDERREAELPPFSYQALLRSEATKADAAQRFLDEALSLAREQGDNKVEYWGPVPAPMERRAGRYRAHLLLQAADRGRLQKLLSAWVPRLQGLKSARQVRWSIDVDPQEVF
ncbi:primosomal protein N' [Solemya velesiana gill symbiont]|uniref:Replication restart protein PriA n=1 Tax=Solemya velesiana gill symbiont TaxID=1918948 RepID=A0A1T2KXW7_9GAMM|nr:primosomal protein N' [Solemya velesiana gill symbiont]OOZ37610.1 primosomal protein N' [Solemya velesiana gill symbiont]